MSCTEALGQLSLLPAPLTGLAHKAGRRPREDIGVQEQDTLGQTGTRVHAKVVTRYRGLVRGSARRATAGRPGWRIWASSISVERNKRQALDGRS